MILQYPSCWEGLIIVVSAEEPRIKSFWGKKSLTHFYSLFSKDKTYISAYKNWDENFSNVIVHISITLCQN